MANVFPKLDDLQSIFTSAFFTLFPDEVLPKLEDTVTIAMPGMAKQGPRHVLPKIQWDGSDRDLSTYLNLWGAFLGDTTCNIDTGIGYDEQGRPVLARVDPINVNNGLAQYHLKQFENKTKFYFPTRALTEALNKTKLTWVDLQAFEDLPPAFAIRLYGFKVKVNGDEVHNCDEILLVKDTTPMTRRKAMEDHGIPPECHDSAIVIHWLTQSRDEIQQGLQSQTFGTFVLHKNMKLDEILETIDAWSRSETVRVQKESVERGLLTQIQDATKASDARPGTDDEEKRLTKSHAEYLTNTLNQASWDEENREWYVDVLRFVFKFVLLLSAEAVRIKPLPPPGVKEKGNLSRKARKVHEKLWKAWGRRYLIDVPPESKESLEARKAPTRHEVSGHFTHQAYGPGRAFRKVIWICPFWRGAVQLQDESEQGKAPPK